MNDVYYTEIVAFGKIEDATVLYESLSTTNGGFSFNRLIPMPLDREYEDLDNWRSENWGTKSDCDNVNVTLFSDGSIGHVSIGYSCPCGSSTPVPIKLSKLHPKLDFLVKEQINLNEGEIKISTLSASKGLSPVVLENTSPMIIDDDLDLAFTHTTDTNFIDEWSINALTKKAMILLGYGEEERLFILQTHNNLYAGNLPFETASHTS